MLQFIRDKSQGWIAWLIIGVICLIFALWGIRSYLYSAQSESLAAKVNGSKITQQQLSVAYNQLKRSQLASLGGRGSFSSDQQQQLKMAALQGLIENLVQMHAAIKDGFNVAPDLVDAAIAKMPIFQINGVFSEARFQQFLNGMLFSPDQFYQQVENHILSNQVQFGVQNTAFVLPSELKQTATLIHQTRSFSYSVLPIQQFLSKISPTKADIQNYYQAHQDQFKVPAQVSLQYIELSVKELMQNIHPTASQIKAFYDNNIASYTRPKEWKVARILIAVPFKADSSEKKAAKQKLDKLTKALTAGKDFAILAKTYSDDQLTASHGGVLPWQSSGQFSTEVRSVMPSLNKVGDISRPIYVSGQGYVVLKVLAIRPEIITPFSAVREKVFAMYRQQKAQQQFGDLSDQLSNITYESPNSLEPAAKQLGLKIKTTELFTKAGGSSELTKNARVLQAAFSDDVTTEKVNSDPINLNDDDVVVVRAQQFVSEKVKSLAVVKSDIVKQLKQSGATKLASAIGKKALEALQGGMSLSDAAKKYGLSWREISNAQSNTSRVPADLLLLAFQSPAPASNHRVFSGNSLSNGDYALIALSKVTMGNSSSVLSQKKAAFSQATAAGLGELDYLLYQNDLMSHARIKRYSDQ